MDTKKKIIYYAVLLIGITIMCNRCRHPCPMEVSYNFNASLDIRSGREYVRIGDTIFFESIVPSEMRNTSDNALINFSGSKNFGSTLRIGRLVHDSATIIDAVAWFDYYPIEGKIFTSNNNAPDRVKQLLYNEKDDSFILKFGLIPKDTGIFLVAVSDAINVTRNKGKCERANIEITITNRNKHLDYLQDLYYQDHPMAETDKTHAYCFVVK